MSQKKPSGYYLLKEPHWAFESAAVVNPVALAGALLRYAGILDREGETYAPFSGLRPNKGDHLFVVESEGDTWMFEVPLSPVEIERFVEPVKIAVVHWIRDTKNHEITISWGFRGKQSFFKTGADLVKKLNEILKTQGVLLDGALIWCLDLPWKESPCKFFPAGSKIE